MQGPGHVAEIVKALGEDSEFHETHGYYLDPISPELPVLPTGWGERLVEVQLGEVFAYFLDVHDTAISKYARGADNDYRWIDAGYEDGILSFDKIDALARFGTDYPGDEDKKKVRKGIESHRVALLSDGTLDAQLLEYLRSEAIDNVVRVDDESGHYSGEIVWIAKDRAVQAVGAGKVAVHVTHVWGQGLHLGRAYSIEYEDDQVKLSDTVIPG